MVAAWARGYERAWLRRDLVAGLVIWSVVTPQAVAYAQIAGLPPQAGLMAAPGALAAYALLGTSRTLVVSATTATAAVSAATVGPLADGDAARFAALSAALALVVAVVLALGGALKLGAIADLVAKPVMTGFLFGLGLTIMVSQLPALLGVAGSDAGFLGRLEDLAGELGQVHGATLAVGAGSVVVLVAGKRLAPQVPTVLLALALAIGASALLGLEDRGVDVVGDLPSALPDPALPDVALSDLAALVAPALGVLVLSAEATGVARGLAAKHGYEVDPNRDLVALGASNLVAGLSSGFVQSGGASQTAAAEGAGRRTQLGSLVAAGLILLTGAFLAPLFEPLPQATLAAIVIVAVVGFLDLPELQRFARLRRSAIVFAVLALVAVLVLGVLQGLVVTAGLTLVYLLQRLARPAVRVLTRDAASGTWTSAEDGERAPGAVVLRPDALLIFASAASVKQHVLRSVGESERAVLDLSANRKLDVETLDMLGELARALPGRLALVTPHRPARELLHRAGLQERITVGATIDAVVFTRRG